MPPLIVISDPAANLLSVYFNTFAPDLQPPPPRKTPFFASENREYAHPLPPPFTPQSSVPANSVPLSEKPFVCLRYFRTAKILFLHLTGKTIVRPYLRQPLLNLCTRDKREPERIGDTKRGALVPRRQPSPRSVVFRRRPENKVFRLVARQNPFTEGVLAAPPSFLKKRQQTQFFFLF